MIPKINEKPTMVIAGSGAGKTHDMVSHIVDAIPALKPNRILAAITFTNAATESIREKLQKLIHVPQNVFIGTTYSFFNRFILLPFATLFDHVPADKMFLEIDTHDIAQKKNLSSSAALNAFKKKLIDKLLSQGKIPFENISRISSNLIEKEKVRRIVCNRLQFIFKDEFQDTDTVQLKIFDAIRKGKKTKLVSVGDPEQYITGFRYKGVQRPTFKKIPINKFSSKCNKRTILINRRACKQLVDFTNNFHTSIKQRSEIGHIENAGVFFITCTDLDIVIAKFFELTKDVIDANDQNNRFFLGYENATFDGCKEKYGLVPISNDQRRPRSMLTESIELISSSVQQSPRSIMDQYDLSKIELRRHGIRLLKEIIAGRVSTADELISFINNDLKLFCQMNNVKLDKKLDGLKNFLLNKEVVCNNNYHSSIHKAKGLEADCVLVVSKNLNELTKWLKTDYEERCKDTNDTCRIGYVGFTRAKRILCIACKEPMDSNIKASLRNLNVTILN